MRYRVTYNGQYLFHVMVMDAPDARGEAGEIARKTMRAEVVNGLEVQLDNYNLKRRRLMFTRLHYFLGGIVVGALLTSYGYLGFMH